MKLDVLTTDGSPLGVSCKTIYGDDWQIGVGGAELALLTMCEKWQSEGYDVTLYNNPREVDASPFEQKPVNAFNPDENRDILIVFRSPTPRAIPAKGLKVWWSTDQFTMGNFKSFAPHMDKIVVISDFHREYFETIYRISNAIVIDLPVRVDDYIREHKIKKVSNRLIFTSIPDRGLDSLWRMWPYLVQNVPDISLVITSDYRLWGSSANNQRFRVRWVTRDNFEFLGAVSRSRLIDEQLQAQIHIYPCIYDELFCISAAESQVAGAYPITTDKGALYTTNMGTVLQLDANNPRDDRVFADIVIDELTSECLLEQQEAVREKALERFHPDAIFKQWEEKGFGVFRKENSLG